MQTYKVWFVPSPMGRKGIDAMTSWSTPTTSASSCARLNLRVSAAVPSRARTVFRMRPDYPEQPESSLVQAVSHHGDACRYLMG
ncbi:hypothetical protein GCM10009634_19130 [Saccharothrix xinjiangensis]